MPQAIDRKKRKATGAKQVAQPVEFEIESVYPMGKTQWSPVLPGLVPESRGTGKQKIERNEMKMKRSGFTLVEIMIVVAIIALLAAIAVPSFMSARTKSMQSSCLNNLRLIDGAMQQYALDYSNTVATTMAQLVGTNGYIKDTPVCKAGGAYTLPATLAVKTSCSVHGTL
jgi:prepilin-type N-terminal cleavage/methylation domain-containing protein